MPKYNHMYSISFSVDTNESDPEKVRFDLLCEALQKRMRHIDLEAFSHEDTYEHEPGTRFCLYFYCMDAEVQSSGYCMNHQYKVKKDG